MAYVLTLVSGVPRMTTVATSGSITIKEEGVVVDANTNSIDFVGGSLTATQISAGNVKVEATDAGSVPVIYDESITVGSTITAGTAVTLPASGSYTSAELEIFIAGRRLTAGLDYAYVGSPARTQVTFTFDLVNGDTVRFRKDRDFSDSPTIYDEYLKVVASGAGAGEINLTDAEAGDNITLPLSKVYDSRELEVWLNGTRLDYLLDFTYVGVAPTRTQISMTFNLLVGDVLRLRIDRPA